MASTDLPKTTANRQIARAAGIVMAAFIFSNLVGLLRDIIIFRTFGAGAMLDAFNGATRLTDLLFNLVAGGALASAFIPTFTTLLAREDRASAWRLASSVVNLVFLVLSFAAALSAFFAPQLVRYVLFSLAPGFDPALFDMTVSLLRVMLPAVVIFGVSGLMMGILNTHQVFLVPAIAPAMYSIGQILGTIFFAPSMEIYGLAWGYVIGAGLHLLVQLPAVLRLPDRAYFPVLGLKNPTVREVLRLMGPRLFGVAVVQLNFIVSTMIALGLPEGSVSAISGAFRLMLMPQMAVAQSAAIAALPTFSAQVAQGRQQDMRASLAATLRVVLMLSLPASVGLALLRQPLVAFLYEGGNFTARSTELVAWALLWYAVGLVGHSLVEIVSRSFYALHDTRTPVTVSVVAMGLNILFSLVFARAFSAAGLAPHGGLALANSLATTLEMIALLVIMRRRLGGLEARMLWEGFFKSALASTLMGLMIWGWLSWTAAYPAAVQALGGVVLGGGVYALALILLRVEEVGALWKALMRRIRRAA